MKVKREWNTGVDDFVWLAKGQGVDLSGLILDGSGTPENEIELLRVADQLDVQVPSEVLVHLIFGTELWYDTERFACAVAVYEFIDATKATVEHVLKNVEWHAYRECFNSRDVIEAQCKPALDKLLEGYFDSNDIVWSEAKRRFERDWHVLPVKLFEDNSGHEFSGVVTIKKPTGRRYSL